MSAFEKFRSTFDQEFEHAVDQNGYLRGLEDAAKLADIATDQYMAAAGFIKMDGRYKAQNATDADEIQTKATAAAKATACIAVAAAIRAKITPSQHSNSAGK